MGLDKIYEVHCVNGCFLVSVVRTHLAMVHKHSSSLCSKMTELTLKPELIVIWLDNDEETRVGQIVVLDTCPALPFIFQCTK